MTIITNDGITLTGTPDDIVSALRRCSHIEMPGDNSTYMADVASRVRLWNGVKIGYRDAASFLTELKSHAFIDILEP